MKNIIRIIVCVLLAASLIMGGIALSRTQATKYTLLPTPVPVVLQTGGFSINQTITTPVLISPGFSTNSTGSGNATIGTGNFPGATPAAVNTWISVRASDNSTVYIPAWK